MGLKFSTELVGGVADLWLRVKPWKRLIGWRNKRRAAKGKPPLREDDPVIPQNTLRKTGAGLMALGPVIAVLLNIAGVGECSPEAIELGCVGASQISGALLTLGGGAVFWVGQNRAHAREQAAAQAVAEAAAAPPTE
jgi:hypothetical protein